MTAETPPIIRISPKNGPAIMRLTRDMGWDHQRADWETMLRAGAVFGHLDDEGELLSASAIFPYSKLAANIGMVMVRPECQGRGLGLALVEKCLAAFPVPEATVSLISTAEGQRLYEKAGFEPVAGIATFLRKGPALPAAETPLPTVRMGALADVLKLDAQAFGAPRFELLKGRLSQAVRKAVLEGEGRSVRGMGMLVTRDEQSAISPVIAEDRAGALELVRDLAGGHEGDLRIDIFEDDAELAAGIGELGFELKNTSPLMTLNGRPLTIDRDRYFAVAAQAFL